MMMIPYRQPHLNISIVRQAQFMYYGKRTSLVPTYDTLVLHDLISLLLQMAKEEVQIHSVKIMIEKYECELTRK